jgi:pimeloyl-ACP methyl ester carboxylesterase
LTDYFDIVGFDPRGVGESSAIDCLTDDRLDAYIAEDPDPDTVEEGKAFARMAKELGSGCLAKSGDLANHVSTIEAARDMDVLRAALGEGTLDYFGASYGTKLGATYAELFPDRVGRLVLDGALDLTLSPRDLALQQAAGFQQALEAYVANCVETTDSCFLGDSVEEGLDTIERFLASVEAEPIPAGDRQLEVGNAFYGIVTPLYVRDYWYLLSTGLKSALDGDGTTLMLLSDAYTSRDPGGNGYLDNVTEANLAISCLDDPRSITPRQVPQEYAAFDEASRTFGRVFAWGMTNCRGFTTRTTEKPREIRAEGAPPILVVGTTRDPATPLQWAQALAEQLESGVLITRDGDGHTAYNSGNECIDRLIEGYLVDGVVPDDGASC